MQLKVMHTDEKPTATFTSYSTYGDFGIVAGAFAAIVGGRGGKFSVSLVAFSSSVDFFFFFRVFLVGVDNGLAIRMF